MGCQFREIWILQELERRAKVVLERWRVCAASARAAPTEPSAGRAECQESLAQFL
jgi:hypothetical protein